MRLLAIRGRNLASLAEPFEIDLAAPPLATAGLFAITGPTGAGKSTILDALCLALFSRLPRLPGGAGTLLGREEDPSELRIATTDVRGVLRRGAGFGWAEAEFSARDGHRYLARWEVRRARNRPGGKLQDITQTLLRLDDRQPLGGTLSETRAEIERLLGLSFEQFRRAVLLAQGDFAAFLKAPARDRSALLEQITGTEIYSRLSRAAYERAGAEKLRLGALEERGAGFSVLDTAGRAALEADVAAARETLQRAEAAAAAAKRARDWHIRLAGLEGDLAAARGALAAAQAAREAAADERRELEAVNRVQPLRPALEASGRTAAEAAAAGARTGEAGDALAKAETAHAAAAARLAVAERRRQEEEAVWTALEPELERALLLDSDLARLEKDLADAGDTRGRAAARAGDERAALGTLERDLAALAAESVRRQTALADRSALVAVAGEWPRWKSTLERAGAAVATLVDSRRRLTGLSAGDGPVNASSLDCDLSLADAERELAGKQAVLADLSARPLPALDRLRAARTAAEARRDILRTLRELTGEAARSVYDRSVALAEMADRSSVAAAETARAAEAWSRLALTQASLAEAEAALHRLHLARSGEVETLRAGLAAGEPCPVCGAGEHPWAGRPGAAFDALVAGQRQRVDALKGDVGRWNVALGGHRSAAAAARRDADSAERRVAAAAAKLQSLREAWLAAGAGGEAGMPDDPADSAAAALLTARLAEVEADSLGLVREERAADAHRRQVAVAEAAVLVARAGFELARVLAELEAPFAGLAAWRSGWAADSEGFGRRLAAEVAAFLIDQTALAETGRRRDALAAALTGAKVRSETAAETLAVAAALAADIAARRARCLEVRRGVLAGRAVAAVRAEAALARQVAGREQAEAAEDQRACALALARAVQARDSALDEARGRQAAAAAARAAFEAELAAAGTGEEAARRLLSRDRAWLEAAGARLAALERVSGTAAATLAERQRLVDAHCSLAEAPAGTAAESDAGLALADAALGAARERAYDLGVRVREDDKARAALAGLAAEIERQRRSFELWGGLDEVIGSASGDKFRRFAQGLSLDQLLGHANAQLADLARRYRLERAAGSDLEIQVADRDMGDEVRSVHSLSGGETFLISLALALGLSAMAGGGAGTATLFIDEGFGALDPDSLDVALSCLEALQAGGRSVGVVSHVPAMIERIGVQVRVIAEGGGRSRVETLRRA